MIRQGELAKGAGSESNSCEQLLSPNYTDNYVHFGMVMQFVKYSTFYLIKFNYIHLFIYLFIVLRFQTSYNSCIKEAGTPQQLNTNYSGPFTKYQYKYRKYIVLLFILKPWTVYIYTFGPCK